MSVITSEHQQAQDDARHAIGLVQEERDIDGQRRIGRLVDLRHERRQGADQRQPRRELPAGRGTAPAGAASASSAAAEAFSWHAAPCFISTTALAPSRIRIRRRILQHGPAQESAARRATQFSDRST